MNNSITINGEGYEKVHTGDLNSPGGIAIRHHPDGELLAYLNVRYFDKGDLLKLINSISTKGIRENDFRGR